MSEYQTRHGSGLLFVEARNTSISKTFFGETNFFHYFFLNFWALIFCHFLYTIVCFSLLI